MSILQHNNSFHGNKSFKIQKDNQKFYKLHAVILFQTLAQKKRVSKIESYV